MKNTPNENDVNDILPTFRELLLSSSVHCKLNCSDHAASSCWSLRRKVLWKMKNVKSCFGSDVVVRSIHRHMTQLDTCRWWWRVMPWVRH